MFKTAYQSTYIDLIEAWLRMANDRNLMSHTYDIARIDEITDSDFPYLVDLQYYESIKNPALKRHIDRVGKVLFRAEPH